MEGSNIVWFIAVVVGTGILGAAIAWGMVRTRSRTRSERIASEEKTREIYRQEDPRY